MKGGEGRIEKKSLDFFTSCIIALLKQNKEFSRESHLVFMNIC